MKKCWVGSVFLQAVLICSQSTVRRQVCRCSASVSSVLPKMASNSTGRAAADPEDKHRPGLFLSPSPGCQLRAGRRPRSPPEGSLVRPHRRCWRAGEWTCTWRALSYLLGTAAHQLFKKGIRHLARASVRFQCANSVQQHEEIVNPIQVIAGRITRSLCC